MFHKGQLEMNAFMKGCFTGLRWCRSFIFIVLSLPFWVVSAAGIAVGVFGVIIGCIGACLLCLAGIAKIDLKSMTEGWARALRERSWKW